jgi:hypothetical protein
MPKRLPSGNDLIGATPAELIWPEAVWRPPAPQLDDQGSQRVVASANGKLLVQTMTGTVTTALLLVDPRTNKQDNLDRARDELAGAATSWARMIDDHHAMITATRAERAGAVVIDLDQVEAPRCFELPIDHAPTDAAVFGWFNDQLVWSDRFDGPGVHYAGAPGILPGTDGYRLVGNGPWVQPATLSPSELSKGGAVHRQVWNLESGETRLLGDGEFCWLWCVYVSGGGFDLAAADGSIHTVDLYSPQMSKAVTASSAFWVGQGRFAIMIIIDLATSGSTDRTYLWEVATGRVGLLSQYSQVVHHDSQPIPFSSSVVEWVNDQGVRIVVDLTAVRRP